MRVLGLDPGLRQTGWGVIDAEGNRLRHVANGVVVSDGKADLAERLLQLYRGVAAVVAAHRPETAAVEVTLANKNPSSTLKLGMARGIAVRNRHARRVGRPSRHDRGHRRQWRAAREDGRGYRANHRGRTQLAPECLGTQAPRHLFYVVSD